MRAILYTRVSTDEQVTHGVSLKAQEERLRAYATASGLEIAAVLHENGICGGKPLADRPQGATLLRLLGSHRAEAVIALKLDRLFRDTIDALTQTQAWDRAGIALHIVDLGGGQALNTTSPMGRLFLTMTAAFAELERNLIGERTRTALRHKRAHLQVYSRVDPYGFRRDGGQLVPIETDLIHVRAVHTARAGGATLTAIAADLNARSVPTKTGRQWSPETVRKVLRNPIYRPFLS